MFRLTRKRTVPGRKTKEVAYGFTSLPRERADADRLLALVRRHWEIENRLHYVRDATLGENACRVRMGASPQVLAGVRNTVLHILRDVNPKNAAAAIHHLAAKPLKAIRMVIPKAEN